MEGAAVPLSQVPTNPVRLFSDPEDPCVKRLQVLSIDQVGLLFKLCEVITSHGLDICSAEVVTEGNLVHNHFELHTARPSDFDDASDWCQDLERFLLEGRSGGSSALEESIAAASKHLSVNLDLVSVVAFEEIPAHHGQPSELRYNLELKGINQAGLLTHAALVLYRSGFSVVAAGISTFEGHISDKFELSTYSAESEHLLRSYLDMPMLLSHKENVSLPFHTTQSEANLQSLMQMWDREARTYSPIGSGYSTPLGNSRRGSFQDAAAVVEAAMSIGEMPQRHSSNDLERGLVESRQAPTGDQLPSSSSGTPPQSGQGARSGQGLRSAQDSCRLSVHFANGDVYTGTVSLFDEGEKRHGLGTYIYSDGSHQTYQQYRGQWREDRKHGYGVLFYRNGGVYVGQWENNQKQGLGVLLDNQAESDRSAMPSFRYEGQWQEDQAHGLGTEESDTAPSYFGQFVRGKRHGRGVQMSRSKVGIAGCEALDRSGRPVPLIDALESELNSACQPPSPPSFPSRLAADGCSDRIRDMEPRAASASCWATENTVEPSTAALLAGGWGVEPRPAMAAGGWATEPRPPMGGAGHARAAEPTPPPVTRGATGGDASGSSSTKSTQSPQVARLQNAISPSESFATPMLGAVGGAGSRCDDHRSFVMTGFFPSCDALQSPAEPPGMGSAAPAEKAQAVSRSASGAGDEESTASQLAPALQESSLGAGGGRASSSTGVHGAGRGRNGTGEARKGRKGVASSPRGAYSPVSPRQASKSSASGNIVFSLCEENNLLSPRESKAVVPVSEHMPQVSTLTGTAAASSSKCQHPWERGSLAGSLPPAAPLADTGPIAANSADASLAPVEEISFQRAVSGPPPWSPREPVEPERSDAGDEASRAKEDAEKRGIAGMMEGTSGSLEQGGLPSRMQVLKQSARLRKVIRTPLLWSEDELAAFVALLGISPEVCARVKQRKLKGTTHVLEMSNAELRREFGLTSPVERLVVRQSLKRLLDMDRWENGVRGRKVGDILGDSVLGKHILPFEELTLVTKVSQGGYGTVYRGVLTPSVDRVGGAMPAGRAHLVAVKEMKGERTVRLHELLKEACVMASLHHPNICTFIGVCADASARKHYIVSELMDCSLFDLIHQPHKLRWHGELTVLKVLELSKGICAGIVYMHTGNLVHADLKSSNILIDYSSSVSLVPRICDFGHAAVRTFPSPHHRCGTPHWAAPEVLRGEALGPDADIYSFGVIMWEMLTRELPHKGLSFGQVLASVGWAGWTPELVQLPAMPRQLQKLLRECLSFLPAERPQGATVQLCLRRIPRQARLKALKMLTSFLG